MRAYEYSINPAFKLFTSNQYISSLLFKTHENNHYSYSSDNNNIPLNLRYKFTKKYCIKLIISGQKVKNILKWMEWMKNKYRNCLFTPQTRKK